MSEIVVYVLMLENDKIFLYPSTIINESTILLECETLYEFVRQNPFLRFFETITVRDEFELNMHVKYYMQYFGMDNVRGGSYTDIVLPDNIRTVLENEVNLSINADFLDKGEMLKTIRKKYFNIETLQTCDPATIPNEITNVTEQYNEYLRTMRELEKRTRNIPNEVKYIKSSNQDRYEPSDEELTSHIFIDESIIEDLYWISERIQNIRECLIISNYNSVKLSITPMENYRYRTVICKLQLLYKMFLEIGHMPLDIEPTIYLNHPNIFFDRYFYHSVSKVALENEESMITKLLECFAYMTYVIVNQIEEFKYDISTYSEHYETKCKMILSFLEIKLREYATSVQNETFA
jgi:hypothetical protein